MMISLKRLFYGKQYGYKFLFSSQDKCATGKIGVIIAEMGMPEVYEADFYSRFMEHVFRYVLPPFLHNFVLADNGMALIDPSNPLAREEFKPEKLIDSNGSFTNKSGIPYVQCVYKWKPPIKRNPWDHGYFLYTEEGPSGRPDICDKIGAKIVGWYYGKLLPQKRVAWRSQLDKIYQEATERLSEQFRSIEFRKAYFQYPETIHVAVEELIAAGCETIIYQSINCPLYCDFEDYGFALPLVYKFVRGRSKIILADQLGNQPVYREAYFQMLKDQLKQLPPESSVLVILSMHGHPFKKESMDLRAHLYRQPLEDGMSEIMSDHCDKWEIVWSFDDYADKYWDKKNRKVETYAAYKKAIDEKYDYAIEFPTEFPAENTDLMIFHAMKKFTAFSQYDCHQPIPYPNWEIPLIRKFREGKTTGIYAGTPVGPYRKYIVQAVVDSISGIINKN